MIESQPHDGGHSNLHDGGHSAYPNIYKFVKTSVKVSLRCIIMSDAKLIYSGCA